MATAPLLAEHGEAGKDKEAVLSVMKGRPSLRVGDWLKVDFRTKIQADFRGFRPEIKTAEGWFDPRRLRLGIQGRATSDLEFQIEFDLLPRHHQLRDAFVNYRRFPRYQLQAGKFKIPFGLDQLTEPTDLDFVYRSRIGEMLAPGRDTGIMVHGVLFEQELRYSAGLFRHDGENAEIILSGARTLAARLTGSPAAFLPAPAFFKGLELGAAFTHTLVPEGLTSLRGRSVAGETFFPRMYVRGTRWRQGLELNWQLGSLSLKGEYMGTREERLRQSLLRTDLPPLRTGGWYVSATHPLFGQRKDRTSGSFLRSLIRTNGVEAVVRYEVIRFGSEDSSGSAPSRSPRATNVWPNQDRAWSFGINWYTNPYTKLQFNAIREAFQDPLCTPVSGIDRYWMFAGRVQFVL